MPISVIALVDDLVAETSELETVLHPLSPNQWLEPTPAGAPRTLTV